MRQSFSNIRIVGIQVGQVPCLVELVQVRLLERSRERAHHFLPEASEKRRVQDVLYDAMGVA